MRRVMSLWLPNWPIDRWRRQESRKYRDLSGRPFVLANSISNRWLVSAADTVAETMGIVRGMPIVDARALYPALAVVEADPTGDVTALAQLAVWCGRYSPWTTPNGGDGVWLDVTGCAHLRGGEAKLASELAERLNGQGIACRAAIADTPGAAWAVARCSDRAATVLPEGSARQALAPLPVAALRLDLGMLAELERLGLRRIGDLYVMPRAALAARFGDALAYRLDQALGVEAEPLSPLPPPPSRWVRRQFAEPIGTAEDIAATTRALLEVLCQTLADEMLGVRHMTLTLYRVDGTTETASIGTARPSRDSHHLLRLIAERLVMIDPGLGIEDVVLAAPVVERLEAMQLGLGDISRASRGEMRAKFPDLALRRLARGLLEAEGKGRDDMDETALAVLVDRLANRLGPMALGSLVPKESHLPERAVHFAPVFVSGIRTTWDRRQQRPIRLLPRPELIEATAPVPDDPPVQFRWRRLAHRVRRADGPERIAGEWWRGAAEAAELRDYYCVEDETGRRFWLYRAGVYRPESPPRWFMHGLFG